LYKKCKNLAYQKTWELWYISNSSATELSVTIKLMFTSMYMIAIFAIFMFFVFYCCAVYLTNKDEYVKKIKRKKTSLRIHQNGSIIER